MGNLLLHVDGSCVVAPGRSRQSFGWSVVALHDDKQIERFGHIITPKQTPLSGRHEHIAFIHGVLYANELGIPWKNVTIICDDELFGAGPNYLNPDNHQVVRSEQLLESLSIVSQHCFDDQARSLTIEAMQQARIVKVKGHCKHVYQERADYLAKFGAHEGLSKNSGVNKGPLEMNCWLKRGIEHYKIENGAYIKKIWHAPFVLNVLVHNALTGQNIVSSDVVQDDCVIERQTAQKMKP